MKTLAIDTSRDDLIVALIEDEKTDYTVMNEAMNTHSTILMRAVENLLFKNKTSISEIDCFAVCVGPGSFTGIRIGLTTVKAFAKVFNRPCIIVNSLEVYAYNIKGKEVLSVLDAKHEHSYFCRYKDGIKSVEPYYASNEEILKLFNQGNAVLVGRFEDESLTTKTVYVENFINIIKQKIKRKSFVCAQELEPLYLRQSQAEEGRK